MRFVKPAVAALGLVCGGCVVAPPPAPMYAPAPVATAAPVRQNCREFEETITVGGKPQKGYGTTCQQPDGSWKVVAQPGEATALPPPAAAYPAYPAYPYPAYYYRPYYPPFYGNLSLGFRGRF